MSYLKYDTDKILSTKKVYEDCVTDMVHIQLQMRNMVSGVKQAWQSNGGDAFFDKYTNEWLQNFTQYQEVLSHMAANLNSANSSYSELTDEAEELKIK